MSKERLTDTAVNKLPVPVKGNRIFYDGSLPGFGVRVTAGGTRAFILNYRTELGQERRFTIGHELGHIKRKHLQWGPFLWPTSYWPLIGAAYSRAREYTCDQFGLACCENSEAALKGLIALSAGEKLWTAVDIPAYLKQAEESSGFWMSFHELVSDYPWLVKRAARIHNPENDAPSRDVFAWILAIFIPRFGYGGSVAGMMVVVAIIGILAAIAIPQFNSYRARAQSHRVQEQMKGTTPYTPHFE